MLTQKALANKRHNKKLKRKNKKYTGPKYSRLEQLLMVAPILEKGGIKLFEESKPDISQITGDTSTSFVE
jgi:hypothetical protein